MKILLIALIAGLFYCQTSFAQTNKPGTGLWGIGYQVNFSEGVAQSLTFSRMLEGGWEAGSGIGFNYFHSTGQQEDSTTAFAISGPIPAIATNTNKNSSFTFSFSPFLLKHLNITNNLDCYFGPMIPLRFGTKMTTKSSNEISAQDYFNSYEIVNKTPATNGVGLGVVLGSRFFFYQNLAIGATYNLSGIFSFQNGESISETTTTNSGSDNPSTTNESTKNNNHIKNTYTSIGTSSNFGLNLTFYFN